MKAWLLDTGPFVAFFDRRDRQHEAVAAVLESFTGQVVTTLAVVTEVMYFLAAVPDGARAFAEFLVAADARIDGVIEPGEVVAAADLMRKYADTPMDFADATLVLLAESSGLTEVLTLDRRGFSTYRTPGGKRFKLVLEVP